MCFLHVINNQPQMVHISYKKNSIQIVYGETLPSMEAYYSLKLSMVRAILLSSLKQEMVNNNVEICGNLNLKWSIKRYLDILFWLGEKNTVCGLLTGILKDIDLA